MRGAIVIGKLFSYRAGKTSGIGVESSGFCYDINTAIKHIKATTREIASKPLSMIEALTLVNDNPDILTHLEQFIDDCSLQNTCSPPEGWVFDIPLRPGQILAIGRNYAEHAREGGHEPPIEPIIFSKLASSITAHKQPVKIPRNIGRVDHEIELGVIIGSKACKTPSDEASGCIAGYTIFNDVTAREIQRKDAELGRPWTRAKGFDTFGPCGPFIVPACYLSDPQSLELKLKINGIIMQHGFTKDMISPVKELIAYASNVCTLSPGDMLITGTPAGVSPLKHNDVITAEIEPIGILENKVLYAE